jgi:hypothetical protein
MRNMAWNRLWVLADKRGTILEANSLRPTSLEHGAGVPLCSFWRSRGDAIGQIKKIKDNMTPDAWETWQIKARQYRR